MAARIPQMPPLDPNRPDEAFRQITAWGNDVRLALESRQAAMEGLTLNPESPLWAGRNLPRIPTLPVPVPTGFQAWGVYDAIQLVWDFQPDPAIDGYELLRDSAIIDFVRANCYTDMPDRGSGRRTPTSCAPCARATAGGAPGSRPPPPQTRRGHDPRQPRCRRSWGMQTAAMARNAATEMFARRRYRPAFDSGARAGSPMSPGPSSPW